jgi:Tfp pilus assembly protein PilV
VPVRARDESGFGLIELLMAMVILNIGILAIVGAFNAGIVSIQRASAISTGSVLADQQMELYRALPYDQILLTAATIPAVAPYTTDAAYSATQVTGTCGASTPANACNASRIVDGTTTPKSPDHRKYRVDTFIVTDQPTNASRTLKRVTVVVRDGLTTSKVLGRETSTFDCSTGEAYGANSALLVTCPTS